MAHPSSGHRPATPRHPRITRRSAIQAGAVGLLGLGSCHLGPLRAARAADGVPSASGTARSIIYIFLSGGLSQIDSFDPKPDAPADIRGEFGTIETATPGLFICEHLPELARRSDKWALVRSMTHPSNDHSLGHHIMLTGRSLMPPGFDPNRPKPSDWPSIASTIGALTRPRNNLPPAVVLPERLIHRTGREIPGQGGGLMGARRDPWFLDASPFDASSYGAYPEYAFDHQDKAFSAADKRFQVPSLDLPEGLSAGRLGRRVDWLEVIDRQREDLDRAAAASRLDSEREAAVAMLLDAKVRAAFDLEDARPDDLARYGANAFGRSLLMARRLVEAGVNLVQVNLGNNEAWDTHGNAFPHLKEKLFPPTDRSLSALLDDLQASGLLDETLIVVAGEFGRTPKISRLPEHYALPGRDHWGRAQSVLIAGGGVRGGTVIGATDKVGGAPARDPQSPENLAATIYDALGLPRTIAWHDEEDRPHHIYYADPIPGLTG